MPKLLLLAEGLSLTLEAPHSQPFIKLLPFYPSFVPVINMLRSWFGGKQLATPWTLEKKKSRRVKKIRQFWELSKKFCGIEYPTVVTYIILILMIASSYRKLHRCAERSVHQHRGLGP